MQIEERAAIAGDRRLSAWRAWVIAARPHTLSISINPVLVGCSLAWVETGRIDWAVMLLAMLGALLLQTGTNLDNDVSDFERGTDRAGRLGLPRATQLGLLSTAQVRTASRACFVLATLAGLALAWHGGWAILLLGVLSALAAMAYSGGPRPISYTPFGDAVVLLFFGFVAVCGSYYLQTLTLSPAVWAAAAIVGLPASAVLVVNNYRDLDPDRQVGKITLAVCMGRAFSRWEYALLMLLPYALLGVLAEQARFGWALLIPLITLPMALGLVRQFWRATPGPAFNPLLARTATFQVMLSLVLCVAILLS
ncbi:1,4-dihydroxy-2-naphthoate octaprenyltransferase [Rubrivivax sp. A210]|uniref:1,4-dihydroxy-2-naphthoate polyprenyltransferase n=1 Tax=Rubrivivax sp. A210 TaxID=2772301 RepID=UPI001918C803|nr:1,4-dihydroxy-2-naphthoate polyprenyltransferase [Rubrivivax sp. A210]CAD5375007.1 1,4-dihydroxy-2-naphthoate octaprenyltransferase [Rubrivivax sp. A210]